jgi:hypothetical protein
MTMADILIRGMEMPENCHVCVAGYGGCCYVAPPEEDGVCPNDGRPNWCPLIVLRKRHGRLIDAGALYRRVVNEPIKAIRDAEFNKEWFTRIANTAVQFLDMISDAPTIVPAEKEDTQ